MNLDELRAELEKAKADKMAEIERLKEQTRIRNEMAKLDSPLYAKRELSKADNAKLDILLEQVEEHYAADGRKLSRVFGYGLLPGKILTLIKAIQYSKATERDDLLMSTGLDEQTVEDIIDAFGATAYYNKTIMDIVPAQQMDIDGVKNQLKAITLDMGLLSTLDLSKFNIDNVRYQYERAQMKAEEMKENTEEYAPSTAVAYEE